jgi:hypothetical protein
MPESTAADFQKIAEDPIIAKRLGDTGQIISVLGPPQFGARVQEQRDKLAAHRQDTGRQSDAIGLCFRGDSEDSLSQRTTSFS